LFGQNGNALIELRNCPGLKYVLVSNSVTVPSYIEGTSTTTSDILPKCVRQLNIAPLLAEAIARSVLNESISGMLSSLGELTPPARKDV